MSAETSPVMMVCVLPPLQPVAAQPFTTVSADVAFAAVAARASSTAQVLSQRGCLQ